MNKKLSIIATSVLSLAVVMSGCASKKTPEPSAAPTAASTAPAVTEAPNESGLPLTKETVTIKGVAQAAELAPPYNEMKLFKDMEAATNVKVEWQNIPKADYQTKKNLLLATGNLPDFFYGADFTDTDIINYSKDGTIIPLDDLIEKHMPNVKKLFEKYPEIKAFATAPDGHIYALPSGETLGAGQNEIGANPDFLFINKAWLDKLSLKVPTTLQEYHDVLLAFKTKDPNGNGKADEVPLSFMNNFWTGDIGYLFGALGIPDKTYQPADNTFAEHLNVDGGKVSFSAVDPKFKDAVIYFNKWVAEGLIDKDSFTYNNNITPYFAKGKTGTLGSYLWWEETEIVGTDKVKDYVLVPPFKDMIVKWNSGSQWARSSQVITKAAKNPEIIAKWFDYQFDPKITAQMHWGPIGVALEEKGGILVQKDLGGESPGEFRQKVAPNQIGIVTAEDFEKVVAPEPRAKERMDRIKDIFAPQMQKEKYPLIFFTPAELDSIAKIKPDLQKFVDEKRTKWLWQGGVEKEWDAYLATLKKMGLDDLMKIYQDGLDRYNKAAK